MKWVCVSWLIPEGWSSNCLVCLCSKHLCFPDRWVMCKLMYCESSLYLWRSWNPEYILSIYVIYEKARDGQDHQPDMVHWRCWNGGVFAADASVCGRASVPRGCVLLCVCERWYVLRGGVHLCVYTSVRRIVPLSLGRDTHPRIRHILFLDGAGSLGF